jgi:uncharacterized integral membrane protein
MKTKIILFMIIIVLFTYFVTQNTDKVTINVFFWKYYVSAIILIIITGFVGVLLGLILGSIFPPFKKIKDKKIIPPPDKTPSSI